MNRLFVILTTCILFCGCQKQNDWLDAKRETSDVVPKTLADFQSLLDNTLTLNANYPTVGLLGCDNFYFPDENVPTLTTVSKNSYFWQKDIYGAQNALDYVNAYNVVNICNIVLENIITADAVPDIAAKNNVQGQALFFRSFMFCELASVFCKPFAAATASTDLGICVRLKSDIYHVEPRSSVQRTYNQIVNDLQLAAALLPVTPLYRTRPSKPAAFALLARTYLLMDDYAKAKSYADSCIKYFDHLLDFNGGEVSLNKPYRFPVFNGGNQEIIFYAAGLGSEGIIPSESLNQAFVDSALFKSYNDNDLRKTYFYDVADPGKAKYRGTYTGIDRVFAGISCNEVYFVRAECNARLGDVTEAVADMNKLLSKRFKTGQYPGFVNAGQEVVLRRILEERRKEFPFTGQIRWQDLRRLNKDSKFATTLYRRYGGNIYQLNPNDPKYVYPLPQIEVDRAGLPQNER